MLEDLPKNLEYFMGFSTVPEMFPQKFSNMFQEVGQTQEGRVQDFGKMFKWLRCANGSNPTVSQIVQQTQRETDRKGKREREREYALPGHVVCELALDANWEVAHICF